MMGQELTKEFKQEVFEKARRYLESNYYFGLNLSLSELIELKSEWVPRIVEDLQKINPGSHHDFDQFKEVAGRFIFNNYTQDTDFIRTTLEYSGIYSKDHQAELEYLKLQQARKHIL